MRNVPHRSICRLRRAARRVGGVGIRRGWWAETPTRGAPSPAPLQSCASGSPSAWIPCEAKFSPSPGSSFTPSYHFLLHPGVSTWLWGPWLLHNPLSTCLPLSTSCLSGCACQFLSICLSMSVCSSLSLSFSLCQPVLPSSLSVHLISLCLLTGFSLLLYISLILPSLDRPAIRLSHCPSVHMASVSVSRAIGTRVFPLAQPLSVQQQSFCLPYSVPTVYGQTPLCPPSSPIPL